VIASMQSSWVALYLGISTCLIFFNPFHLHNEIFPYWFFLFPFLLDNVIASLLLSLIFIFGLINHLFFPESRALLDALSLSLLLNALYIYSRLNKKQLQILCNLFKLFIILSGFVMLLQKASPNFEDFIIHYFSGRENLALFLQN
jgi:hypothetical protein